ncbi:MAG TPA: DUF805 domain-containing protein [Thermohalobaculum sp.]|nr:DUF805 domain-containing protein [Thermohalobaculum sp.]
MGFDEAILRCLSRYAVFTGRAEPAEFWWFALLYLLLLGLTLGLLAVASFLAAPGLLALAALAPAAVSVTVRRLHDIGAAGSVLLFMVPVLGQLLLLAWLTRGGAQRTNRFGRAPEKEREEFLLVTR